MRRMPGKRLGGTVLRTFDRARLINLRVKNLIQITAGEFDPAWRSVVSTATRWLLTIKANYNKPHTSLTLHWYRCTLAHLSLAASDSFHPLV